MPARIRIRPPDESDCFELLARHKTPEHVIRHSRTVCGVAMYLAGKLVKKGYDLDLDLIRAAALLHDITKSHSFKRPLDHALTGAKLLKKLGYHEVAAIVRQHVRLSRSRPRGRISEVEVVNYADKRVVEDRITTLSDRIDYIRRRYGITSERRSIIDKYSAYTFNLEQEIFEVLAEEPARIMFIDVEKECKNHESRSA
ncbi:MAG: HD domain-containing protein [Thermodesulfobacteriota bacterium]